MERKLSPHAVTIVALLNNIACLTLNHHEYTLAKDVTRGLKRICAEFGFKVEDEIFDYIVSAIGNKPQLAMEEEFDKFSSLIYRLDAGLDKEPLANDKRKSG